MSCLVDATVRFSPALSGSGHATTVRARVRGKLTVCVSSDPYVVIKRGVLTGSFASGFGAGCSWNGAQAGSFSIAWRGDVDGTVGDTEYQGRASFTPSTVHYSGEQGVADAQGHQGFALPGAGNSSTTQGSFPGSASDDRAATLYSSSTSSALRSLCRSKQGLRRLNLEGAITIGPGVVEPDGITTGPDGALWFTNVFGPGRVSTGGSVGVYSDADTLFATSITSGPDGALWFTNALGGLFSDANLGSLLFGSIGRLTPAGALTTYAGPGVSLPAGITTGPDGALWFTNDGDDTIGRISTAGVVTTYQDPSVDASPTAITTGPDGALWFTNTGSNSIGSITTSGSVTLYYSLNIDGPTSIAAGPDGALWYTNAGNDTIGRITTSGVSTSFSDPGIDGPTSIAAGPDGALWFTNGGSSDFPVLFAGQALSSSGQAVAGRLAAVRSHVEHEAGVLLRGRRIILPYPVAGGSVGRITTSGAVTTYTDATMASPAGITAGPDGALWFTNSLGGSIGRITTSGAVTAYG
ncbi:MAG TPA: hypothetical protein VLZ77_16850 [Acidimicrobiales bacterium]|nr:hypothetical protein [Acidimicrobiales bacterium]